MIRTKIELMDVDIKCKECNKDRVGLLLIVFHIWNRVSHRFCRSSLSTTASLFGT